MTSCSEPTLALLREVGWSEDRRIDTGKYQEALRREGFPVYPVVIEFLERFGGLKILYPNHRSAGATHYLSFGVGPLPADVIDPELIQNRTKQVGTALCYIGEGASGNLSLLMDSRGSVYAANEDWLAWVGDSGCDAIEAFCTGREFQEVAPP